MEDTFSLIKDTLRYSVNTWNPRFLDKLYAGTNPIGVIAELVLAVLNNNGHVYHCSPVVSLMEVQVTRATARLLGMGEQASGLFCPGGSASNLLAMVTARNRLFPTIKTEGYFPRPMHPNATYGTLTVFTSTHSHYSIAKSAQVLGLGLKHVIKVPTDKEGRMDVDQLEQRMQASVDRGETPFFINATSGTTVMGAFDPLDRMAKVARQFGCWLHADGSWGGSAIFSEQVQKTNCFKGSQLVDSFTMNPHKLLGVPLQCSMLLAKEGHGLFAEANSLQADYLFHGNEYDLGAGTIGCGRRPDALKVFLAWKFYGQQGLGKRVDRAIATTKALTDHLRQRPGFHLVQEPPFVQVCFWYLPEHLDWQRWRRDGSYDSKVSQVTRSLHEKVNQSGRFLVDRAPLVDQPDFFRLVINAPTVRLDRDLIPLLDLIETTAKDMTWSL
ncbi:PLP-dependent transferase [Hesseltinella vesiculosa]|uniref:PLP-dependent transferase n=1 Tax=Hesseltinella vesiculosa TaxID=101127 RepID=A0A1X2GQ01_9FUNG|nr:PLP-dependent transferase [Hesseltinella vesiculosa]